MTSQAERVQQLVQIEREIASALSSAGQAIAELSRDKPTIKQVESHSTHFLKTLESVESGLTEQINYLTTVSTSQPHEGSSYAAHKDLQMAFHRLEHVRSRLTHLEKMKNEHLRLRQQSLQRSMVGVNAIPGMAGAAGEAAIQRSFSHPDPMQGLPRTFSGEQGGLPPSVQRSFSQNEPH